MEKAPETPQIQLVFPATSSVSSARASTFEARYATVSYLRDLNALIPEICFDPELSAYSFHVSTKSVDLRALDVTMFGARHLVLRCPERGPKDTFSIIGPMNQSAPMEPPSPGELLKSPAPSPHASELGVANRSLVFHYTDQAGLNGIASNQELWATRAIYLNDSVEIMEAFHLAAQICKRRHAISNSDERTGLEQFIEYVREVGHVDPSLYIVSMSESGDMLSQWRGYGSYAIGLDWELLSTLDGWRLVKCRYDRSEQEQLVEAAVERALWGFRMGHLNDLGPLEEQLFHAIFSEVIEIAPAIKHSAFFEEREWRIVNHHPSFVPESQIRQGQRSLVEYVRIPLPARSVHGVIVGPGTAQDTRMSGAGALLRTSRWIGAYSVTHSAIPYLP